MGEAHVVCENGKDHTGSDGDRSSKNSLWYEEELGKGLKWTYSVSRVLHRGTSAYQDIALLETGPFGKVLLLDGKMQSAEADEYVYHEALVHPALLSHPDPQNVFIMGGGEGSTAREVLKHKSVKKLVMCDIDEEVVSFCRAHLAANRETFQNKKMDVIISDARMQLEATSCKFDIIIGDLADPIEGGPCNQLYTKSFYQTVVKSKLRDGGIFVTQAGPAGILSHMDVFSSVHDTLKQVFRYVIPYATYIPSYSDVWGWVMASNTQFGCQSAAEVDSNIKLRLSDHSLKFLDGTTYTGMCTLNKRQRQMLHV
uniref:thermospermine synthase n=1 Tax=Selaginella moellendorffii TaxID=88036 RepID=A0AA86MBP7_SELML|nr:thermospermine synthase-like protein [Selaginella moellendorffii]